MNNRFKESWQSPLWQRKRLEILHRDHFQCQACNSTDKQLQVHHRYYVAGRKPWEYPGWAFQTLCDQCHKDTLNSSLRNDGTVVLEEWETLLNTLGSSSDMLELAAWLHDVQRFSGIEMQTVVKLLTSQAIDEIVKIGASR